MKGIRLVQGKYVQARLISHGVTYAKMFGPDNSLSRELASIWLAERRKESLMGKLGVKPELPSKTFKEASLIWLKIWSEELNPNGEKEHNERSISEVARVLRTSLGCFSLTKFESIRPNDIEQWRIGLLHKGIGGTSVNRYQAVLSSVFNGLERWVKTEKIAAFRIPEENPCDHVKKAPNVKRKRVLSIMELKALKAACYELKDNDLWEICEMALKSLLRKKDLFALESGAIDTIQSKTGRSITLPVSVLRPLQYANFRRRWELCRKSARLVDVQFRDLRKTGANLLKMRSHSNKLISEFLGHASTRTTEIYMVEDAEHLRPLANDLSEIIKSL